MEQEYNSQMEQEYNSQMEQEYNSHMEQKHNSHMEQKHNSHKHKKGILKRPIRNVRIQYRTQHIMPLHHKQRYHGNISCGNMVRPLRRNRMNYDIDRLSLLIRNNPYILDSMNFNNNLFRPRILLNLLFTILTLGIVCFMAYNLYLKKS